MVDEHRCTKEICFVVSDKSDENKRRFSLMENMANVLVERFVDDSSQFESTAVEMDCKLCYSSSNAEGDAFGRCMG